MTTSVSPAKPAEASALPDINAETYPFEVVQQLLDRAAYLSVYSIPVKERCRLIMAGRRDSAVIGMDVCESLHRFQILPEHPSQVRGFRAATQVGERIGEFTHRWRFAPGDFRALPGREPPPTALSESGSQRFVMLDSRFVANGGSDGFRGFGTGTTFRVTNGGQARLLAAAVGTIVEGQGRFRGRQGTYTYCGTISPHSGFQGSLFIRVVDPEDAFLTRTALPSLTPLPDPEPDITYLLIRGQKRNREQKTAYRLAANGEMQGLDVSQQLRLQHVDCAVVGGRISTSSIVGATIGEMGAKIDFNLLKPGAPGTPLSPIPFKSYNTYKIAGSDGSAIGSFDADGNEGRTFMLALDGAPGQLALRFGGFGPILNGRGYFEGISGMMTDNSVVGVSPHAIVTSYILRIHDPQRRFRSRFTS